MKARAPLKAHPPEEIEAAGIAGGRGDEVSGRRRVGIGIVRHLGLPVAVLLLLVVMWEVLSVWFDSALLPSTTEVAAAFGDVVATQGALDQVAATLERLFAGLVISFVLGNSVGILMGRWKTFEIAVKPTVLIGLTLPSLVYALLTTIWFGASLLAPVLTVVLATAPALAINAWEGAKSFDSELIEMAHVYRIRGATRLRRIYLPGMAPFLFNGARLSVALGWKVVVIAELFGQSNGVGYQISAAFGAFRTSYVIAWTLVFAAVIGVLEFGVFGTLERRAMRWRKAIRV